MKPGSKPHRMQLRNRLTDLGFSEEAIPAQVVHYLIAECRIRPRIAWRLTSELSLDLTARQFNALNGDQRASMRGSRIWEYEQWPHRGVRPTMHALRILANVYGTTWHSLLDLSDLERLPPEDLAEYHAATKGLAAAAPVAGPAPPPAGAVRLPAPTGARADALAQAMTLTRTNVDGIQVDDLWSDLNHLGNAYARASPASLLPQLSLVRDQVTTLLAGRQPPKRAKKLYLLSAKCCAMMAWMSADQGQYRAAQEFNSAAWLYCQYADDHLARRWVRTVQSRVEYWAGNGAESVRLATEGLSYKVGDALSDAPLILAEARGWASVRADRQVLDAIGRWARVEDSDPVTTDEDRFFNISKDRRHYMAGTSLLSVGRVDSALWQLRTAWQVHESLPPERRWDAMEPMIRIDTSRAYLRLGDLDGVVAALEPLLATDGGRRPDMVRAMLRVMTTELKGRLRQDPKAARELVDALLAG